MATLPLSGILHYININKKLEINNSYFVIFTIECHKEKERKIKSQD